MLLKRAADLAEALYSVPRPHSQLQALPSSPVHGSVMGLSSYPSQLGVSIGDPGQSSGQGERGQRKSVLKNMDDFTILWYVHNSLVYYTPAQEKDTYMSHIILEYVWTNIWKKDKNNKMEKHSQYCKAY